MEKLFERIPSEYKTEEKLRGFVRIIQQMRMQIKPHEMEKYVHFQAFALRMEWYWLRIYEAEQEKSLTKTNKSCTE